MRWPLNWSGFKKRFFPYRIKGIKYRRGRYTMPCGCSFEVTNERRITKRKKVLHGSEGHREDLVYIICPYTCDCRRQGIGKNDHERTDWIIENLNGAWYNFGYHRFFVFELEEDAMAFKLRWM
jgi:hypothetical protein